MKGLKLSKEGVGGAYILELCDWGWVVIVVFKERGIGSIVGMWKTEGCVTLDASIGGKLEGVVYWFGVGEVDGWVVIDVVWDVGA